MAGFQEKKRVDKWVNYWQGFRSRIERIWVNYWQGFWSRIERING